MKINKISFYLFEKDLLRIKAKKTVPKIPVIKYQLKTSQLAKIDKEVCISRKRKVRGGENDFCSVIYDVKSFQGLAVETPLLV